MKSKRKRITIGLLVITGLVAGVVAWWWVRDHETGSEVITLYGNVEIREARLGFTEQERVAEVLVEEGDTVEAGQVLARQRDNVLARQLAQAEAEREAGQEVLRKLEAGPRSQEIEQARAKMAAAEARQRNAAESVRRLEKTAGQGASSEQQLDDARAKLDVAAAELEVRRQALRLALEGSRKEEIAEARARVEAATAQVSLLNQRIEDLVLQAPADGVIRSRVIEAGEIGSPDRPAFVLALSDPKWVRAYLPEPELGLVVEGMPAQVSGDSLGDEPFDGWVGFISPVAEFTPRTVQTTELRTQLVYEVRVWVNDPDNRLRLGMPVTVELHPEQAMNRHRAVAPSPPAGKGNPP